MPELRIETIVRKLSEMLSSHSGIKVWDVYGRERQELSISAERGAIKTAEVITGKGYAVRVYGSRGNIGFAHSNITSKSAMEATVTTAVKMLTATNPDPEFKDLPTGPSPTKSGLDFFDKKTSEATVEMAFEILNAMLEKHAKHPLLYSTGGSVGFTSGTTVIQNSHGIDVSEKYSTANIYFEAILKEGGEQTRGWWGDSATALKQLDPQKISDVALERAETSLHPKVISSGDFPVVFSPPAVKSVILRSLTSAISAENVQYQRTFLRNSLNKSIGSEIFNVVDDPFEKRLTGSQYFDDEGVPTRRLELVRKGVLQFLLHNSYTAFKAGAELTGHARRAGIGAVPDIGPNNLIIPPGDATMEELLEGIKYGVYFDDTGDSLNLATGDFSGLILTGRLIQDGALGPALSNTMMGINLKDLFARIDLVGKDQTVGGSYKIPHVRVSSAKITSGA